MMGATHLDTYLQLISDGHRRRIIHQLRDETTGKATVEDPSISYTAVNRLF